MSAPLVVNVYKYSTLRVATSQSQSETKTNLVLVLVKYTKNITFQESYTSIPTLSVVVKPESHSLIVIPQ